MLIVLLCATGSSVVQDLAAAAAVHAGQQFLQVLTLYVHNMGALVCRLFPRFLTLLI